MDKWISLKDGNHEHLMLNMKKMSSIFLGREQIEGKEKCCIYFQVPEDEDAQIAYKSPRKRNKAMKAIQKFIQIENALLLEIESDRR